jgi:hypothetical protein
LDEGYLSTGDVQLDLAAVSAHEGLELLADTLQKTETVVLAQGGEEVLDDLALVAAELGQLLDDLLLVAGSEGRGGDEAGQLAVGLEDLAEVGEGLGGLVKGGGLGGRGVLRD